MSLPEDTVTTYLNMLFGSSEPGDAIHHLLVAALPIGEYTPLGLPDYAKLEVTFFAIAPVPPVDPEEFITRSIVAAISQHVLDEKIVHFMGLATELLEVVHSGSEISNDLAEKLHTERRLDEHPSVEEVTRLYAAARDGRRWWGRHILTGLTAGVTGPVTLVGGLDADYESQHPQAKLIRAAVGR